MSDTDIQAVNNHAEAGSRVRAAVGSYVNSQSELPHAVLIGAAEEERRELSASAMTARTDIADAIAYAREGLLPRRQPGTDPLRGSGPKTKRRPVT